MSNEYKEPTLNQLKREATEMRIFSGYKLTEEQALDRLADSHGWVDSKHMIECKKARSAP